jgi:hypothetical protein
MEGIENPNFEPAIPGSQESPQVDSHQLLNVTVAPTVNMENHQKNENVFKPSVEMPSSGVTPSESIEDPVTKMLQRIFNDPATLKLLAVIISIVSIVAVSCDIRGSYQSFPSFVVNGASLIYSAFTIFVTIIWKKQDNVAKSGILKKIFAGRNIHWHEIHSTATLMLAFANFSCVFFYISDPLVNIILALTNTVVFCCEFYKTIKAAKTFVTEERVPQCNCKLTKYFLVLFKNHSKKFNFVQLASFITAFVLYLCQVETIRGYFFYCSVVCIIGSASLLLMKVCKKIENHVTNNNISISKIHTYLSLGITIHAFLAVLTNSITVQTNWSYYYRYENVPTATPVGFSFTCVIFALSFLDLYSQAFFNKSRPFDSVYDPLIVKTENQKPFRNLPTIIENPLGIEGVKEVYDY